MSTLPAAPPPDENNRCGAGQPRGDMSTDLDAQLARARHEMHKAEEFLAPHMEQFLCEVRAVAAEVGRAMAVPLATFVATAAAHNRASDTHERAVGTGPQAVGEHQSAGHV